MSTNKSAARAGDAQFFDTSRALGVIGIVAAQSIEAYIAAIGNRTRHLSPPRQFHQRRRVQID